MLLGCCHCGGSIESESESESSIDAIGDCTACGVAPARFKVTMTMPEFGSKCTAGCSAYKTETTLYHTAGCTWESAEKAMLFSETIFGNVQCCDMTDAAAEVRFRLILTSSLTYSLRMFYYAFESPVTRLRYQWTMAGSFGSGDCFTSRTLAYSSATTLSTTLTMPACVATYSVVSPCGTKFGTSPTSGNTSGFVQIG